MRFTVPGVFIVCCEHGVVYGYHLMVDPEGRKDLFYVLYERFPQQDLDNLTVVCVANLFVQSNSPVTVLLFSRFMTLRVMLWNIA